MIAHNVDFNTVGKRFVYRIGVLIRTARIHHAGNKALDFSLRMAVGATGALFEAVDRIELLGEEKVLHLNGQRLRLDRAMVEPIAELMRWLRERGVGGFTVARKITAEDLRAMLTALLNGEVVEDRAGQAETRLADALNHAMPAGCPIRFMPALELTTGTVGAGGFGEGHSVQVNASRALHLYIRALKAADVLRLTGGTEGIPRGVVRVIQHLVEMVADDPRYILGLIHVKHENAYDLRHQVHTTLLSIALGQQLGLGRGALLDLGLAALTCNLGMLSVDPAVLEVEGPLSEGARAAVQRHPLTSARLVLGSRSLDLSTRRRLRAAFESDMGFAEGGYPATMGPWPPHLFSRIIAVTETFDALTTDRPWRAAWLADEALAEMLNEAGHRLDPTLVAAFVNLIGRYPLGTAVVLDTGELGVVYLTPRDPREPARPVVRLLADAQGDRILEPQMVDLRERREDGAYARNIAQTVRAEDLGLDVQRALFS
ncbi:MAG: hypothetical protein H6739_33205 [Alphaproteobacteria bacterium]|nr:hypothetical protein [Alphaproteobacteria bacterium]